MTGRMQGAALLLLAAAVALAAAGLGGVDLALPELRPGMARVLEARDRLDALEAERQGLLDRRQALLDAIDRSRSAQSDSLMKAGEIEAEIARIAAWAGRTACAGQGVRVTLSDAPDEVIRAAGPGAEPGRFIVHDRDLLRVIHALWAAGAEAIAVNGERYRAGDAVLCVGPSIRVGERRLAPPYIVEAIGDGDALVDALTTGAYAALNRELAVYGIGMQVEPVSLLVLPGREGAQ
ncbi:MAG: DUF881 domain-containing protein [Christensenellales bacterium]|jgi:uncharacterized protein YlxW (UPF0749 family)